MPYIRKQNDFLTFVIMTDNIVIHSRQLKMHKK